MFLLRENCRLKINCVTEIYIISNYFTCILFARPFLFALLKSCIFFLFLFLEINSDGIMCMCACVHITAHLQFEIQN